MLTPESILEIVEPSLKNNKIIGDLLTPGNISLILQNSLVRPAEAGEILCHQGQIDRTLYLLINGEVEVSVVTSDRVTVLGRLGKDEIIGEISAIYAMPRIANVTVTQPSVLLEIPAQVFVSMLRENQDMQDAIVKRCRSRILETSLRSVPVFATLDQQSMNELCYLSSLRYVDQNAIVANEGKAERSMYVVCSGVARVYTIINGKELTIALLHPGDYFGEYSFFTGGPRSASISALTDLHLVVLEGEPFYSFIEYNVDTENDINQTSAQRQHKLKEMRYNHFARESAEQQLDRVQKILTIELD